MIICAAIKFYDKEQKKEIIIPGLHHADCYYLLAQLGFEASQVRGEGARFEQIDDGFLDHNNKFLSRADAWKHAKEIGQLSELQIDRGIKNMLFSEDII